MRHGRKSRSKRFNGYKEHIARDLDAPAILACAVTPANRPEEEAAAPIAEDIERQGFTLGELHIDRAYVNSPIVTSLIANGGKVLAKPWGQRAPKPGLFSKGDFRIDLRAGTITCPAGAACQVDCTFQGACANTTVNCPNEPWFLRLGPGDPRPGYPGRDRGSPKRGITLLSKRVMMLIRSPRRVRTISPFACRTAPCGSRRYTPNAGWPLARVATSR